jgi:adenylate cyclase
LADTAIDFTFEFRLEKTRSEYKRVAIFSALLIISLITSILNVTIDPIGIKKFFNYDNTVYAILVWCFFFLSYELIFLIIIRRFLKRNNPLPEHVKSAHAIAECLFPGILMLILLTIENKPVFLDSPFFLFFFVLIVISALQLEPKASYMVGLLSALQYMVLTYYVFQYVQPVSESKLILPAGAYYIRSLILFVSGIAAGLVAKEINKQVKSSFKQIIEKQKIINLFGQQVSKEIVQELVKQKESLDVKKTIASIMFLDIRNFSTYAETRDPGEIIIFQNNIFNPLIEIISKYKGIVNQFLGDGFMASFGIPVSNNNYILNSFNAGVEIIKKIKEIGEDGIIPPTRVGIGLHYGEVITGNIGNDIRKQYSIAGSNVIIASRLEQLNKQFGTEYLVTKEIYEKVKDEPYTFESLGKTAVKGFENETEIICVKI